MSMDDYTGPVERIVGENNTTDGDKVFESSKKFSLKMKIWMIIQARWNREALILRGLVWIRKLHFYGKAFIHLLQRYLFTFANSATLDRYLSTSGSRSSGRS